MSFMRHLIAEKEAQNIAAHGCDEEVSHGRGLRRLLRPERPGVAVHAYSIDYNPQGAEVTYRS